MSSVFSEIIFTLHLARAGQVTAFSAIPTMVSSTGSSVSRYRGPNALITTEDANPDLHHSTYHSHKSWILTFIYTLCL